MIGLRVGGVSERALVVWMSDRTGGGGVSDRTKGGRGERKGFGGRGE